LTLSAFCEVWSELAMLGFLYPPKDSPKDWDENIPQWIYEMWNHMVRGALKLRKVGDKDVRIVDPKAHGIGFYDSNNAACGRVN
jgi:hypothetical protein